MSESVLPPTAHVLDLKAYVSFSLSRMKKSSLAFSLLLNESLHRELAAIKPSQTEHITLRHHT